MINRANPYFTKGFQRGLLCGMPASTGGAVYCLFNREQSIISG